MLDIDRAIRLTEYYNPTWDLTGSCGMICEAVQPHSGTSQLALCLDTVVDTG